MEIKKRKSPKITVQKKDEATVKYEEYLKSYARIRSEKGEFGKGLRELSKLQKKLLRPTTGETKGAGWSMHIMPQGNLNLPVTYVDTVELEPTQIDEYCAPFPLSQDPQDPDTWHGTIQDNRRIELFIYRDFKIYKMIGNTFTGKFQVCPTIYYAGVVQFAEEYGSFRVSAKITVEVSGQNMLTYWDSAHLMPNIPVTIPYYPAGNNLLTGFWGPNLSCDVSCDCGAVVGNMIRVTQNFIIETTGAIVDFGGVGGIYMGTPTLSMWCIYRYPFKPRPPWTQINTHSL